METRTATAIAAAQEAARRVKAARAEWSAIQEAYHSGEYSQYSPEIAWDIVLAARRPYDDAVDALKAAVAGAAEAASQDYQAASRAASDAYGAALAPARAALDLARAALLGGPLGIRHPAWVTYRAAQATGRATYQAAAMAAWAEYDAAVAAAEAAEAAQ